MLSTQLVQEEAKQGRLTEISGLRVSTTNPLVINVAVKDIEIR